MDCDALDASKNGNLDIRTREGLLRVNFVKRVAQAIAAATGGILIPIALSWLKVDPAVASIPFGTAVTDVVGFFPSSASQRCGSG
jgi:hypothetical protein